jgi:hypothetical protein
MDATYHALEREKWRLLERAAEIEVQQQRQRGLLARPVVSDAVFASIERRYLAGNRFPPILPAVVSVGRANDYWLSVGGCPMARA